MVVVAGNREAETELARLISDGSVYRFIHKPMSPARARLFAEAAVKRFDEQRRRIIPVTVPATAQPRKRRFAIGAVCAVCGVVGLLLASWWLAHRRDAERAAPLASAPASVLPEPPAPAPPAVRSVLAEAQERLFTRAQNALQQQRLDEAAAAIDAARKAGIDTERVAFLATQLAKARERSKAPVPATTAPATSLAATVPPATPATAESPSTGAPTAKDLAADRSAALAMERIKGGHLVEPEDDNAHFYVQQAFKDNPQSEAARRSAQALSIALLAASRASIDRRDFSRAASLIDAADGIARPPVSMSCASHSPPRAGRAKATTPASS